MYKPIILFVALLSFTVWANAQPVGLRPVMEPGQITASLQNFRQYESYHLNLEQDYTPLSTLGKPISRYKFLTMLMTGYYLPVKCLAANRQVYFKLVRLKPEQYKTYGSIVQDYARPEYANVAIEKKPMPGFKFTDLNGKVYTNANTRGKILVIKCWFIRCHACNEEIPAVNALVNRYRNRKDILFVSLADDPSKSLRDFLKTRQFNYAVVPDQQKYIFNSLHIYAYPTHLLVDKQGTIQFVTSYVDRLSTALAKEAMSE